MLTGWPNEPGARQQDAVGIARCIVDELLVFLHSDQSIPFTASRGGLADRLMPIAPVARREARCTSWWQATLAVGLSWKNHLDVVEIL